MNETRWGFDKCPLLCCVWKLAQRWQFETKRWRMARCEIWIQDECQVNILPLSVTTIIHSPIVARKESWKPSPSLFSVLISRSLARILSITIAHLFSFVSPLLFPFNPFSFPPQLPLQLLSFRPNLSIFPNLYTTGFSPTLDMFRLTSSTCLSSFWLFSKSSSSDGLQKFSLSLP